MGIQDTYFDLQAHLEEIDGEDSWSYKAFEDFAEWAFRIETENENYEKVLCALGNGMRALEYIKENFDGRLDKSN